MPSDEVRPGYREALAETPGVPVTDETSIPGLGTGEWIVPALWAVQADMRKMLGTEGMADVDQLTRDFLAGTFGPVND